MELEGGRIFARAQVCNFATGPGPIVNIDDVKVFWGCHVVVSPSAGWMEGVYCHWVITITQMVGFHVAAEVRVDYVLIWVFNVTVRLC